MATHQISILGHSTVPDSSGEVYYQPYSNDDSGSPWDGLVLTFSDSGTVDSVFGSFVVPQNYVGTPVLRIVWTANATSGTVTFDWSLLARSGTEDMGAAYQRTTETDSTTKGGTAYTRETNDITLTAGDYAAGDTVLFELARDTITDTMAADCLVFDVLFEYADA